VISLFRLGQRPLDLRRELLAQDAIYVGGGSMVNLLAIWRAHRLDETLEDCWNAGVLLCGQSAGAMCWFEHGVTSSSGAPALVAGLGLLAGAPASTTERSRCAGAATWERWPASRPGSASRTRPPSCSREGTCS